MQEGNFFSGLIIQLTRHEGASKPKLNPIDSAISQLNVEFPMKLREEYPIGTLFSADVTVCQKRDKKTGLKRGGPYLKADFDTIQNVSTPRSGVHTFAVLDPNSRSGRAYYYINIVQQKQLLIELRRRAILEAVNNPDSSYQTSTRYDRSQAINQYAHARAAGKCECCEKPAPFIAENGHPYLEVHHIDALSECGSDSPNNIAALCPNCHRQVTVGRDKATINSMIKAKILNKERDSQ